MYSEVAELREAFGKKFLYRDHYCEGSIYTLLEKGIINPDEREIAEVFDNFGVYKIDEAGVEFLTVEEKINRNNCPNDSDEMKSYFKNFINTAVNKKYKAKVLRSSVYNSISINMFYYGDTMTIGIILSQKAVGVNRVYECNDGFYLQVASLNDKTVLYGLEILGESDATCFAGPNSIDLEQNRDGDIYHVMIDHKLLNDNRIRNIMSINLVVAPSNEKIYYGPQGDKFDAQFLQKVGGLAH